MGLEHHGTEYEPPWGLMGVRTFLLGSILLV
jgi:hypothetical protein